MSERKQCVKCGRPIDRSAKVCPYCNWWQSEAPPQKVETPPAAAYVPPPPEQNNRKRFYAAAAFGALLIIAFAIGSMIHGFEPSDINAAQDESKHGTTTTQPAVISETKPRASEPRANVTLVPVPDGSMNTAPGEQPITTTPAGPEGTTSSDATALPSQQYAAAAERARSGRPQTQTIDPRTLSGTAYAGAPARHRPQMAQRRIVQTQPVPEYQPVPRLSASGSARLALTIDADGTVHDVKILRSAQGDMGRLIGAVQSWRFRPAMENGQPVPARFTVDINFND